MAAVAAIHKGAQEGEGIIVRWDGQGRLHGGGGTCTILRGMRDKNRRAKKAKAGQHLEKEGAHLGETGGAVLPGV